MPTYHRVSLVPLGITIRCGDVDNLLAAMKEAGVGVENLCGGLGKCGNCRIHVLEGETAPPTAMEKDHISERSLDEGLRLACQAKPLSDLVVYLPASSLTRDQRLQLTSELEVDDFSPAVEHVDLVLDVPYTPDDLGSDLLRALRALERTRPEEHGYRADIHFLRSLPTVMRREKGRIRTFLRDGEILAAAAPKSPTLGLAVDLGSTKVALFIYDLERGALLESLGFLNPQISFGEDIITRIQYAMEGEDKADKLMQLVVEDISLNLSYFLDASEYTTGDIFEIVLVGNTAMHHLFLGLPVKQLGRSPYLPATDLPLEIKAGELGLELNPAAVLYMPPPIAGFVGSDHLAAVLSTRLAEREGPCLLLDIGTNSEVALQVDGSIWCCSCASGPAFEGGGISRGMRAGEGAIEQVSIDPTTGEPQVLIIGDSNPTGICGSGILAAIASLKEAGIVDGSGRMSEDHSLVCRHDGGLCYYLVPPTNGEVEGVAVTQADVREVQKANGAIRTGVDVLMREAGISQEDVREVLLAGAFGSYIDPAAAVSIALLPPIPLSRIHQVGNAAGAGARGMLLSTRVREQAEELADHMRYVELATYPDLNLLFAASMYLSEEEVQDCRRRFKV
ncbi:MAG: ASKHA domain-containing protein [Actinomycetota bacterium]|nr:ASKHA domain-containing protein [Actinomycetota bacterium]